MVLLSVRCAEEVGIWEYRSTLQDQPLHIPRIQRFRSTQPQQKAPGQRMPAISGMSPRNHLLVIVFRRLVERDDELEEMPQSL